MNVDPRRSYTAKVGVGVLVVLLVSGLVGAAVYVDVTDRVKTEERHGLEGQASMQRGLLQTVLDDVGRADATTAGELSRVTTGTTDSQARDWQLQTVLNARAIGADRVRAVHYAEYGGEISASSERDLAGKELEDVGLAPPEDVSGVEYVERDGHRSWVLFTQVNTGGTLVTELNVTVIAELLETTVQGSRTRVVDDDGVVVLDTGSPSTVGTQYVAGAGVQSPAIVAGLNGSAGIGTLDSSVSGGYGRAVVAHEPIDGANLAVASSAPPSTLFGIADAVGLRVLGLLGVVGLLLVGFTLAVERPTVLALRDLTGTARDLEAGELDVPIESDREDELGDLYAGFDAMRRGLRERIGDAERAESDALRAQREAEELTAHLEEKTAHYGSVIASVADGDLTARVDPESDAAAIRRLGGELNDVLGELEATIDEVQSFADEVRDASGDLASSASEVGGVSDRVAESMTEVSADTATQRERLGEAADEMNTVSATVEEVASTAGGVAATAEETAEEAREGRGAAEDAVEAVADVEERTESAVAEVEALVERMDEIGEVTATVSSIADRTNLLALNANIEAARAGEGSEGFAVVADEVKSLATEAQERADEIETLLSDIRDQTVTTAYDMRGARERLGEGAETVGTAADALRSIADLVEEANDGMQDIDGATDDQAASAEEVAAMMDDVRETARETADEADDVAAAAEQQTASLGEVVHVADDLADRALDLDDALSQFETDLDARAGAGPGNPARGAGANDGRATAVDGGMEWVGDADGGEE
ncbi:methyl-accepting chemotaxis protein [Halorarum halophilum]|uniref:Methyl-accepting chemotaxis protein n=1 Tax=Halorarum halophilum TaxID=2743090 RepID=A0A7D5GC06_9EURY|nr:HAMP domain-containing methyl-accepting chemotaxis protein [Halobaculum halophilum]QLG27906.1 methyl-accepting chemotaxis protein [Halobaculum halophilum]